MSAVENQFGFTRVNKKDHHLFHTKKVLMNRNIYAWAATAAILASTSTAMAQSIRGITNNDELFTIDNPAAPTLISAPLAVTGLASGQSIAGIDFRPNTGELYALGYNAATGNAQLYTINTTTAVATAVGASMTLALGTGSVGFDFNPTVDRIRVTAANRKNYRLHPVTGAIAATDGDLTFGASDVNSGALPSVGASAYTNSYIGAEATTLFNYEEGLNIITTQVPPNDGTQNTIGASGITVNASDKSVGMDIYYDKSTNTNIAYLSANTLTGTDQLYTVNLATGATTLAGVIGLGVAVKDITVTISRELPAVTGQMVYALTKNNNNFISFDSENPSFIRSITPVTGITTDQKIVGMDFRPANRELYALGYNYTNTNYQLYTINTTTGAATAVNATPGQINLGSGGNIGFDFNPVPDRIRVVSAATRANYRLNPVDGSIAATDSTLNFIAGDVNAGVTPYVGAVAYTNSYAGTTTTLLHGVDDSTGLLLTINPPNEGKLNTLLAGFLDINPADPTLDMDFYYDSTATANIGFLAANTGTSVNDDFYTVTTAGVKTLVGRIGFGIPVTDIAVRIDFINAPVSVRDVNGNKVKLSVYPNPVGDQLFVSGFNPGKKVSATVVDLYGRRLFTTNLTDKNAIPVAALAPGVYFAHLNVDGEVYLPAKFVKQ